MNKGCTLVQISYATHADLKKAFEAQHNFPSLWTFTDDILRRALHDSSQLELPLVPSESAPHSLLQTLDAQLTRRDDPARLAILWRYVRPQREIANLQK